MFSSAHRNFTFLRSKQLSVIYTCYTRLQLENKKWLGNLTTVQELVGTSRLQALWITSRSTTIFYDFIIEQRYTTHYTSKPRSNYDILWLYRTIFYDFIIDKGIQLIIQVNLEATTIFCDFIVRYSMTLSLTKVCVRAWTEKTTHYTSKPRSKHGDECKYMDEYLFYH
jgi:hypothetical protein